MGKNLKGRELGKGLSQRKDGRYSARYTDELGKRHEKYFATLQEAKIWMKELQNYHQYALILETRLHTGEMIGLTWDAVDLEKKRLTVNKTLEFRHGDHRWRAGPPKTLNSYRTIPLTNRACEILREARIKWENIEKSHLRSQTLTYLDRQTGQEAHLVMSDLVFINYRTGMPAKNSSYDTHLYKLCDKAGIKRFCMHALRHTYATRAIESGMLPKVLQKLLGHASIKTTMDRYVHVTDDSMDQAVQQFEQLFV